MLPEQESYSLDIQFVNTEEFSKQNKPSTSTPKKSSSKTASNEGNAEQLNSTSNSPKTTYLYIQMQVGISVTFVDICAQLCSSHTLRDWLHANVTCESRNRHTMLHWFEQIVDAVNYVHNEFHIIHRDLKVNLYKILMN